MLTHTQDLNSEVNMKKQKGFAPLIPLAMIALAMIVGLAFEKMTTIIDHPVEQASEKLLASHGIDVDFSSDKKKLKDK